MKTPVITVRPCTFSLRFRTPPDRPDVHFIAGWDVYADRIHLPSVYVGQTKDGKLWGFADGVIHVICRPGGRSPNHITNVAWGTYKRAYLTPSTSA